MVWPRLARSECRDSRSGSMTTGRPRFRRGSGSRCGRTAHSCRPLRRRTFEGDRCLAGLGVDRVEKPHAVASSDEFYARPERGCGRSAASFTDRSIWDACFDPHAPAANVNATTASLARPDASNTGTPQALALSPADPLARLLPKNECGVRNPAVSARRSASSASRSHPELSTQLERQASCPPSTGQLIRQGVDG